MAVEWRRLTNRPGSSVREMLNPQRRAPKRMDRDLAASTFDTPALAALPRPGLARLAIRSLRVSRARSELRCAENSGARLLSP